MKNFIIPFLFIILSTSSFSQNKTTQTRDVSGFTFIALEIPATVYVTQENHFSVQVSASDDLLEKITTTINDHTLSVTCDNCKTKNALWKDRGDVIIYVSMPKPHGLHVLGSGIIKAGNDFTTDFLSLEVHGSGSIELKDFKSEKAEALVEGSGVISIDNGFAGGLVETVEGSGRITGTSLTGSIMSLSLAGSGNLKMDKVQSEKLEVTIGGSGSITLGMGTAGNILMENTGSGDIAAADLIGGTVSAKVAGSGGIAISVADALDASVVGSGSVRYKGSPSSVSKNINGSGSVVKM